MRISSVFYRKRKEKKQKYQLNASANILPNKLTRSVFSGKWFKISEIFLDAQLSLSFQNVVIET